MLRSSCYCVGWHLLKHRRLCHDQTCIYAGESQPAERSAAGDTAASTCTQTQTCTLTKESTSRVWSTLPIIWWAVQYRRIMAEMKRKHNRHLYNCYVILYCKLFSLILFNILTDLCAFIDKLNPEDFKNCKRYSQFSIISTLTTSNATYSEPQPFQLYDQNPRICLQTKPAIQRWARSAPQPSPALFSPSLRSTSSLGSCTPHNGPIVHAEVTP